MPTPRSVVMPGGTVRCWCLKCQGNLAERRTFISRGSCSTIPDMQIESSDREVPRPFQHSDSQHAFDDLHFFHIAVITRRCYMF